MESKKQNKKKNRNKWHDKREKKRQHKEQDEHQSAENEDPYHNKEDYKQMEFKIGSPKFDEYYQKQFPFLSKEEFVLFTKTLQEKLPVTFRINQTEIHH